MSRRLRTRAAALAATTALASGIALGAASSASAATAAPAAGTVFNCNVVIAAQIFFATLDFNLGVSVTAPSLVAAEVAADAQLAAELPLVYTVVGTSCVAAG